jgi:hypothetical protein
MKHLSVRKIGRLLQVVNAFTISLGIAISPIAHALQVTIKQEIKVRAQDGAQLRAFDVLPAGSVIDVPVQYRIAGSDGKVDFERTLNNWLKKAGYADSDIKHAATTTERSDYFFPIRVVSAPGFDAAKIRDINDRNSYVALRHLQLSGSILATDSETPVFDGVPFRSVEYAKAAPAKAAVAKSPAPEKAPSARKVPAETVKPVSGSVVRSSGKPKAAVTATADSAPASAATQDGAGLTCTTCGLSTGEPSAALTEILKTIGPVLAKIPQSSSSTEELKQAMKSTFESTCHMSLAAFDKHVQSVSAAYKIPADYFYRQMFKESSGNCEKPGKRGEIGIFQQLRGGSKNPVRSLEKAAVLLNNKLTLLSQDKVVGGADGYNYEGFPKSVMFDSKGYATDFGMRVALTAYNSQEQWAVRAKRDLLQFNSKNGDHLNPNNWDDLRIFFLRRALTDKQQQVAFGTSGSKVNGRKVSRSLGNLQYAELIVPRESGTIITASN